MVWYRLSNERIENMFSKITSIISLLVEILRESSILTLCKKNRQRLLETVIKRNNKKKRESKISKNLKVRLKNLKSKLQDINKYS